MITEKDIALEGVMGGIHDISQSCTRRRLDALDNCKLRRERRCLTREYDIVYTKNTKPMS